MRVRTTQCEVLLAVLRRLRSGLGLDDRNCYPALDPLDAPTFPKGGNFFLAVGFGDGAFDRDAQIGGGDQQCTEAASFLVVIYTRIKTDSANQAGRMLRDAERGALAVKHQVLQALVGEDLVDAEANTFLRQLIPVRSAERPTPLTSQKLRIAVLRLALEFHLEFDWDL